MPNTANRRMPLSCEPCRERKIRCPRTAASSKGPCETCIRRGIPPSECVYLRDLQPKRQLAAARQREAEDGGGHGELLERIRNLEELLAHHVEAGSFARGSQSQSHSSAASAQPSLFPPGSRHQAKSGSSQAGTRTEAETEVGDPNVFSLATPSSVMSSCGTLLKSSSGHERYEPLSSKWSSLLGGGDGPMTDGIEAGLDSSDAGSDFAFSTGDGKTQDLLSILPPVSHCDSLVNIYLDVFAPIFHVLHNPTFRADYAQFQSQSHRASLSWLALLFAVLSVAVTALNEDSGLLRELGRYPEARDNLLSLTRRYRQAVMRCLEADHYLWRHNLHTLQALVLLIYGINHSHGQSWALLGLARNVALALGCHVDPDNFDLGLVAAEERRRAWAALNVLYTIQNATLGNIDSTHLQSNVKLPLDVEDERLDPDAGARAAVVTDAEAGGGGAPSQMSYLLYKFRLYDICSRICSHLFAPSGLPGYATILALDAEITALQDAWNLKYLVDAQCAHVPEYHAVHLNVLFGYSHQLFLLLHRPVLMQQHAGAGNGRYYTREQTLASRGKCLDSARGLLGVHRMLHENEAFRPYRWYNRGLGSFHAFHGAVVIAYLCSTSVDLDAEARLSLKRDLADAVVVFEEIAASSMSRICQRATPILKRLLNTIEVTPQPQMFARNSPPGGLTLQQGMSIAQISPQSCPGGSPPAAQFVPQHLQGLIENLQPQQWLSPSAVAWNEWDFMLDGNAGTLNC